MSAIDTVIDLRRSQPFRLRGRVYTVASWEGSTRGRDAGGDYLRVRAFLDTHGPARFITVRPADKVEPLAPTV